MGGRRRRFRPRRDHRRDGVDRISDLADDLLHNILFRLPSTADAVRTSVLSRRWRRVWTGIPELSFYIDAGDLNQDQMPYTLRGIDAVLAAYSAPTLDRLTISVEWWWTVDALWVAPWLRFAAPRLTGELSIRFGEPEDEEYWPVPVTELEEPMDMEYGFPVTELEVPAMERATAIDLQHSLQLRFAPAGTFASLRVLRIECLRLCAGDLERAVSTQCPCLQELSLTTYKFVDDNPVVSIRSDSLRRLRLCRRVADGQITVAAPSLVHLEMLRTSYFDRAEVKGAHIAAPELSEVIWHNTYDSERDRIVETKRHLSKLEVAQNNNRCKFLVSEAAPALFRRFNYVDELDIHMGIPLTIDDDDEEEEEDEDEGEDDDENEDDDYVV
jgi:hypothetical protein